MRFHHKAAGLLAALTATIAHPPPATARILPQCAHKHGRAYVVCAETGGNPRYMRDGVPHPGPSSATGPYGLLAATRRAYGTADRYMTARYGTWVRAERHHRANGWW